METLKKLEIIKFIKELDYVQSEFNYKVELIREIDFEFKKEVENILELEPDLKKLFESCQAKIIISKNSFNSEQIRPEFSNDPTDQELIEYKDPKIKSLYRSIAKLTHPDLKKNTELQEIYIQATKAYHENNLYPIISICTKLNIPFDITSEEFNFIKDQISSLKSRTDFLETTYSWRWFNSLNPEEKNDLIMKFIKNQIF